MWTELDGDCLSIGTNQWGTNQLETKCGGPNVRGLYGFGTKCVTANKAFIRCFHQFVSRIYSAYFSQFEQLKKNFFLDQLFFLSLSVEKEIIANTREINCRFAIPNWWNHGLRTPREEIVFNAIPIPNLLGKVHIFWEGHKILQNLHLTFDYNTYYGSTGCGVFKRGIQN